MTQRLPPGKLLVYPDAFDQSFNTQLFAQYNLAKDLADAKKTHFFNGRFENIYLNEKQVPLLQDLKTDARARANSILDSQIKNMGCWFNAMNPCADTTLHRHDEDGEQLSGVYYVNVPRNSGKLLIHVDNEIVEHTPRAGQWVFFTPQTSHSVSENRSKQMRLSVAFNFG